MVRETEEKKEDVKEVLIEEVEIDLSLLNKKLNYIISLLEKKD